MAILQHKAEKALEPVGNLLIGAFEDAMPFLEGAGDHLADIGQGIADWGGTGSDNRRAVRCSPSGPDGARSGVL